MCYNEKHHFLTLINDFTQIFGFGHQLETCTLILRYRWHPPKGSLPQNIKILPKKHFSRRLCNSISHSVCPSVGRLVGWSICPSFGPSVHHTFTFLAFCQQFLHHRSCPTTCDCCCHVYSIPHCPCPPDYRSCPTPATYGVVYTALFPIYSL